MGLTVFSVGGEDFGLRKYSIQGLELGMYISAFTMLDSGFRDWGCSHGELHARDMTWAQGQRRFRVLGSGCTV